MVVMLHIQYRRMMTLSTQGDLQQVILMLRYESYNGTIWETARLSVCVERKRVCGLRAHDEIVSTVC